MTDHHENSVASTRKVTFAIVAGEASGDILGAGLIRSLRLRYPNARFVGIGGDEMIAEGFHSLVPMERLSVMGLVEVLGRIRELFDIRARLMNYLLATPPDVVIGIDSPDFTLGIERRCRDAGIPTAHYVSPSVWAWRQKRIFTIAKSVNLMLTLFPFEARFYEEHGVPVAFVGHPLADRIPMMPDTAGARQSLGLLEDAPVLAILPGSRGGEVERLGTLFLEAARWIQGRRPDLQLVIPCVNRDREKQVRALVEALDVKLAVTIVRGRSREVMASSDVVLLASGTATLEAMLLKKPMVVGYRLSRVSYALVSRLVKVPYVALPNLLAKEQLVPELLQDDASPESLGEAVLERLENESERARLTAAFSQLHEQLRQGADEQSAAAISALIEGGAV
ncbi:MULTISPECIES: lipid-A-disaccharide synthase [Marinobacter]|uniref:Lipid-A-disaccharide synthase n=1 Tax=Marinobacter salarius TaxID=1420917 RepID=W5YT66_9GAMM|nr:MULTISPECIES: lipid-A-disaccharide synthase [Marinobacter]AHI32326.1 lipid-A-disaccharide synthase [Marinobacter salarius]KXJ45380.1 MAG: lipid-A-disaccharide synthase [Marinobacter sp. Hex_13]MAB52942.1 lipid-A-disaccharide synthase [Marinobacter sp.]MBS8229448.1 lipid-A-disaccharide synthase [Marinobacter salarius]MCZ4285895.1 lipid-A-disaccharide synthase [Marinobacter salarius]